VEENKHDKEEEEKDDDEESVESNFVYFEDLPEDLHERLAVLGLDIDPEEDESML